MAHGELIISKIKLPNEETYEICDKDAVHVGDVISTEEIDEICGVTETGGE